MANALGQVEDHIGGNFEWEMEPKCTCGMFKTAIDEEKFIFVSNITSGGNNTFYIMPLDTFGEKVRSDGVSISHCPWCGDKITARKKYPTE